MVRLEKIAGLTPLWIGAKTIYYEDIRATPQNKKAIAQISSKIKTIDNRNRAVALKSLYMETIITNKRRGVALTSS